MVGMELKSRQSYILRNIMDTGLPPQAEQLLNELGIARRTLYYDIDKINDWLSQDDWGKIEIRGRQIRAHLKNREAIERKLTKGDQYFLSIPERRAMQIIHIALDSAGATINKLVDIFKVSKNTVLGDIKEIKKELARYYLSLSSTMKSGYLILGEESAVRKMIWAQLQSLSSPECLSMVGGFLQSSLVRLTQNDVDYFELCRCLIRQYELDIGGDCLLPDIHMESMMIQVSWIRSHKGHIINMNSDEEAALMNTLSYRSIELSMQKLRNYEMIIQQKEIYYITSLFLGIQTTEFTTQEQEDLYICDLSEKLISSFERVACLTFANRERLRGQLSHHIRPMYYRLKYGITVKNPLVHDIQRMYPVVSEFTRRALLDRKDPLLDGISADEMAYLCVYFASNLNEKYTQLREHEPQEALIIGPDNMATATLVRDQLEDLFGLSMRYSVITAAKVRDWILDDYALVIALTPISKRFHCKNLVEAGPILGDREQRKIIEVLKRNKSISHYNEMIQDIIERVERNVTGSLEADKLYLDLLRYFDERKSRHGQYAGGELFLDKVAGGTVRALPHGASWSRAIAEGGAALQGESGRLRQRMGNLLQHGKIQMYRMHPDAVLVHCPMQGDVDAKVDVSILLSPDGVVCGDGQQAKILVFVSTVDRYAHWNVLKSIYQYFDLPTHVDGMKQMAGKGDAQ